ncbi:uncharacterized protein LOC110847554 [Folsomia candida]|uniref:uncharacterized protein LOC110847554 n=1 Tax=Folsomia candida TaxID=158441 RepID=UPI000B8F92A2|nr:uncharacterized protein LOC110847554 [Folsomia candida]
MNFRGCILLVIASVALFVQSDACMQKFKRAGDIDTFTNNCFTKAGFASVPTHEDMMKPDFDFKCAAKCIMGAIDIIDDQGKIDKDVLSDFLAENAPEQTLLKLTEVSTACVDSSGSDKISGTKQGQGTEECQAIGKFYSCFIAASDKFC